MELTTETLLAILEKVQAGNKESTEAIVSALDAPRKAAEKERLQKLAKKKAQSVYEFRALEQQKHLKQSACPHQKDNGMPSFGGQVNQDGYARLMCTRCFKIYPPVLAPAQWRQGGIGLQSPDNKLMRNLTEAKIMGWVEWTEKNAPLPVAQPRALYDDPSVQAILAAAEQV